MTTKKAAPKQAQPKADEYVPQLTIRHLKVDPKTTLRKVVRILPSTCPTCGYDVIDVNKDKLPLAYDEMDAEGKLLVKGILGKHMMKHSEAEVAAAKFVSKELESQPAVARKYLKE